MANHVRGLMQTMQKVAKLSRRRIATWVPPDRVDVLPSPRWAEASVIHLSSFIVYHYPFSPPKRRSRAANSRIARWSCRSSNSGQQASVTQISA